MLSDALVENLPSLIATTYPYLIERRRFDYGEVGERLKKVLAELIVVVEEVELQWMHLAEGEGIHKSPILQAFSKGEYQAVIDAYIPKCAKQRAAFKQRFDAEMQARAKISQTGVVWLTPEICTRPGEERPQIRGIEPLEKSG